MKIWVDADACPGVIKEILFKAAQRVELPMTLVANHEMRIPPSKLIDFVRVAQGFDVADNVIVERMQKGDLVVTQDIPLASEVIEKGGVALNPRGELYTLENIRARLTMRNFMEDLRASGVQTGGPARLNQNDRQNFANQLDRLLTHFLQQENP